MSYLINNILRRLSFKIRKIHIFNITITIKGSKSTMERVFFTLREKGNNFYLIIIRHSKIIIRTIVHQATLKGNKITSIFTRINKTIQLIAKILYYHVLRELNNHADNLTNETFSLTKKNHLLIYYL
jgi:predicted transcriptional regulator